jgi:SecD/SecF fusion protein
MTQKQLWQLFIIVFVVAWSIVEITPPTGRNVIDDFQQKARFKDATFSNIVERAQQLQKDNPVRTFGNLRDAVGTNDLAKYFPNVDVKGEKNPNLAVLNRLQRDAAGKIKLGLDLQGGTSFLVGLDTTKLSTNADRGVALENAVEVLRKRVDALGVAEPLIQPSGADRILIQLPGLSQADMERAKANIEKAAFLEFRMVHPESDELLAQGIVEPGYEVLKLEVRPRGAAAATGERSIEQLLVKKGAERGLTGAYLTRAWMDRNPLTNEPEIKFQLNDAGAKLFEEITREHSPKGNKKHRMAIVLDGELYSAPGIDEPIPGGSARISGSFTAVEAQQLASVLENPLEAPVKIIEERTVDPSLGRDSISNGMKATVIGTVAVATFMIAYYLFAGVVATFALVLNVTILMGCMCSTFFGGPFTLTLPGIAGIVLTIGMAVDANVLIFERIREELAAGKSMRGALNAGYDKAFGTIFDSNLTTLISSVILIVMGTGPIQGFGRTLTIGVAVSMFTSLVVTRLIFDLLLARNLLPSLKMIHLVRGSKIDFMRWATPAFIASWLLIVAGIGYGVYRGKDLLGVEFSGGDEITFAFTQKVDVDKLRDTVSKLNLGDPMIGYQSEISTGKENLRVTTRVVDPDKPVDSSKIVEQALQKEFPQAGFSTVSVDRVGPTVGREIQKAAIVASLIALFGILIYVAFRYELSFAVAAIVAIFHDILMTAGWFFLAGGQMSAAWVAAILTIIGFSINDTIVIFDRIREDLKLGVRGSFRDVINQALNQTLSRTIITSGTVLIATLSLYIFGGAVLHDFAFTFLVGILSGTYSSVYIAGTIVLKWHKGQRPKLAAQVTMDNAAPVRV